MKRKRVKCRHCKKGFLVEPGKFPKKLFEHIGKKHPNAVRRAKAARTRRRNADSQESIVKAASRIKTSKAGERKIRVITPQELLAPEGFVVETVTYRRA